MSVVALEGVVEHGQIKLKNAARLPENTKVFVVIPGMEVQGTARVISPRLARPEQVQDFEMEMVEESPDAGV